MQGCFGLCHLWHPGVRFYATYSPERVWDQCDYNQLAMIVGPTFEGSLAMIPVPALRLWDALKSLCDPLTPRLIITDTRVCPINYAQ